MKPTRHGVLVPLLSLLLVSLTLVACSSAPPPAPTAAPAKPAPTAAPAAAAPAAQAPTAAPAAAAAPKEALPALVTDKSKWPKNVSIGTSSIGGTFYIAGGAFTKILEKLGVQSALEVSGGSIHNAQLIQGKQVQFGFVAQGAAYQGWNGLAWAKGSKHTDLRGLFSVNPSYMYGWGLSKLGIKTWTDLNGKNVSGGPAGGTSDLYLRDVAEFLGVKLGKVSPTNWADTTNLLRDGLLEACNHSGGVPNPTAEEAATTLDINFFGFETEQLKRINEKFVYLSPGEIPANTYKGQSKPLPATVDWTAFFTHKDTPEDLVYAFTKEVFANKDLLVATHKSMVDNTEANVKYVAMPMHPGAYRYYLEKGIPVSPAAKPVQ